MRMCATHQSFERCRLSVIAQNYADIHYSFNLPGGAFVPPPDVDVGVVRIVPLRKPYIGKLTARENSNFVGSFDRRSGL